MTAERPSPRIPLSSPSMKRPAAATRSPKLDDAPRKSERDAQDAVPAGAVDRAHPERVERALELSMLCAQIAADNRARDILVLDLRSVSSIVDFFVVATVAARRQGNAIAIEIDQEMKKRKEYKLGIEGIEEGSWVLMDYGDFVVHLFTEEMRKYYEIEGVWGDAPRLPLDLKTGQAGA